MTEWLLLASIRLVDRFRVDVTPWIGDLTQAVIVLAATLAFLALGFASGEPYAYVAAAASAGVEGVAIWLLWLISRLREAPARTTASATSPAARRLRRELSRSTAPQ